MKSKLILVCIMVAISLCLFACVPTPKQVVVEYTLTMAVTGNGTTTPVVGDHIYLANTVVNITATPDAGWEFVNWTSDVADPNSTTTTVTVDADKTVTANFQVSVAVSCDDFMKLPHISREVEVAVGKSFTVALCSDPSTGFQWVESAQISDQTVLQQTDHRFVSPEAEGVVGAAGTQVWTFKTLKKGTADVTMEYSRPWEGGEKGEWTFKLTVVVK